MRAARSLAAGEMWSGVGVAAGGAPGVWRGGMAEGGMQSRAGVERVRQAGKGCWGG